MILLMEKILHHLGYINLVNNGIKHVSTGAGFLPSTVGHLPNQLQLVRSVASYGPSWLHCCRLSRQGGKGHLPRKKKRKGPLKAFLVHDPQLALMIHLDLCLHIAYCSCCLTKEFQFA